MHFFVFSVFSVLADKPYLADKMHELAKKSDC